MLNQSLTSSGYMEIKVRASKTIIAKYAKSQFNGQLLQGNKVLGIETIEVMLSHSLVGSSYKEIKVRAVKTIIATLNR